MHENLNPDELKKGQVFLNESLPIIKWGDLAEAPASLSIIILCKHRPNVQEFFYDMISRYLFEQKTLNVEMFFSSDFKISSIFDEKLTVMEIVINLSTLQEIEEVKKNMKNIETELRLGVISDFHATKIREFKGLSSDRKTALIQEKIGSLIQNRPQEFEKNIFSEMQQFLIMSRDEFKSARDYHHISRIISILYLVRKILKQRIEQFFDKRHVILKFLKTRIHSPNKSIKTVLGVIVGLNFLKDHEIFEKDHLIKAIKNFLPGVVFVENSFFVDKVQKNMIHTCYIEVEKPDGSEFSSFEINLLKDELPTYLKGHIEQLIHPVFMPRNEEEIVRNIVTLSQQLRFVHDIPQVVISFERQTVNELLFNVVLLRILKPKSFSIKDIFQKYPSPAKFVIDRVKTVGLIRRKYLKEASVFRVILSSDKYFRQDSSVDLHKARQDLLFELVQIFGEVRDYNGGMICKQNEGFQSLKIILGQIGEQNELLLEKFFYSIVPAEMTTILKPEILKNLFLMLINAIKREETRIKKHQDWLFKQETKALFIVIPSQDAQHKKKITEAVENLHILSSDLLSFSLNSHDTNYFGFVYFSEDKIKQKEFFESVRINSES
ncbi:MAG: hypothetical protein HZB76_02705 [Chlamydiae bacterium]|nr:hypothetical protein [Chlamydiota bacterium]